MELEHPIVQAPLAGGPSTPALAAAVSEAGGLGFVAAGYRTAEGMRSDIAAVREQTPAPFGVNLFVPSAADVSSEALTAYSERLAAEADRYGVELGRPRADDDGWDAKLDALATERPAVVSFTFGCPPEAAIASLRDCGSEVWVTVTSVAEARQAAEAGADALVLQGAEAGGHRGSFVDSDDAESLGVLVLVRLVARELDLPLVAAGGIGDGAALAAVIVAGAAAAQIGTAFMRASEAGTHASHRQAIASQTDTALTRAFTGRTARGVRNRFMDDHRGAAPAAYPHVHHLTAPLRAAARERGDAGAFNLWAGQAHALAPEGRAADIVAELAADARAAIQAALPRVR